MKTHLLPLAPALALAMVLGTVVQVCLLLWLTRGGAATEDAPKMDVEELPSKVGTLGFKPLKRTQSTSSLRPIPEDA